MVRNGKSSWQALGCLVVLVWAGLVGTATAAEPAQKGPPQKLRVVVFGAHCDEATVKAVGDWLGEVKPDVVVAHWPLDTHPNHNVSSALVWQNYARKGGWNLYFFEVMTDQQSIGFRPDLYLDIATVRDQKRHVLEADKSQGPEAIWQCHDAMHRRRGAECGVQFAEAYWLVEAKPGAALLPVAFLPRKQ